MKYMFLFFAMMAVTAGAYADNNSASGQQYFCQRKGNAQVDVMFQSRLKRAEDAGSKSGGKCDFGNSGVCMMEVECVYRGTPGTSGFIKDSDLLAYRGLEWHDAKALCGGSKSESLDEASGYGQFVCPTAEACKTESIFFPTPEGKLEEIEVKVKLEEENTVRK